MLPLTLFIIGSRSSRGCGTWGCALLVRRPQAAVDRPVPIRRAFAAGFTGRRLPLGLFAQHLRADAGFEAKHTSERAIEKYISGSSAEQPGRHLFSASPISETRSSVPHPTARPPPSTSSHPWSSDGQCLNESGSAGSRPTGFHQRIRNMPVSILLVSQRPPPVGQSRRDCCARRGSRRRTGLRARQRNRRHTAPGRCLTLVAASQPRVARRFAAKDRIAAYPTAWSGRESHSFARYGVRRRCYLLEPQIR